MPTKSTFPTAAVDAQLPETAKLLTEAAKRRQPLEPLLAEHASEIVRQISSDAESRQAYAFWAESRNHDEFADATIVHPALLRAIGNLAGVELDPDVGHAGLMHTYGYLFSTLKTKHGFKRDRWVSPSLSQAFGFREPTLRAEPAQGTLLANATYVFGRIALRSRTREMGALALFSDQASPEAVEFDYDELEITRITEYVKVKAGDGVYLKTDLVTLPHNPKTKEGRMSLLVYSTVQDRKTRLITGFPIATKSAGELIEQSPKSRAAIICPRYNVFIDGLPVKGRQGERKIEIL